MVDYIERLRSDLVEQFKNKPVIDALIEAIGEQLNDVSAYYEDLRNSRGLRTAEGKQLDGIGDMVVLSRKEAGELASFAKNDYTIDDEQYRTYLIYKIWRNTCGCTYNDIIKALKMFWDKPLYYSERIDEPATMFLETSDLSPEDDAQKILNAPLVKPAGVGIHITAKTVNPVMEGRIEIMSHLGRGVMITVLPEIEMEFIFEDAVKLVHVAQNVAKTVLPEIEMALSFADRVKISSVSQNVARTVLPEIGIDESDITQEVNNE